MQVLQAARCLTKSKPGQCGSYERERDQAGSYSPGGGLHRCHHLTLTTLSYLLYNDHYPKLMNNEWM